MAQQDSRGAGLEGNGDGPPGASEPSQETWEAGALTPELLNRLSESDGSFKMIPKGRDSLARHPLGYFYTPPSLLKRRGEVTVEAGFHLKLYMAYALILADVAIEAYTDVLYSEDLTFHVLAFCLQLSVFVASFLGFCLMTSDTFYVRVAQYNRLMEEFSSFFLSALANFIFLVGARLWRLSMVYSHLPHASVWGAPGYYPVYVLWRLAAVWYYCSFVEAVQLLMLPRLYTAACMVNPKAVSPAGDGNVA